MPTIDPWDIKTSDDRQLDILNTFIIFCEDQNCEPIYFRSFTNKTTKIITMPEQGSGKLNLHKTITKCKDEKFIEFQNGRWKLIPGIQERIWCVYDRDMENPNWADITEHDHLEFDLAITAALEVGLNIGWSNDAFELWILLHFEDITHDNVRHRDFIYERLTSIFITLGQGDAELNKITSHQKFNYRHAFKRRQNFITHVLPRLKASTDVAITRARHLESQFNVHIPFHMRNPCTMVHNLVEEINS